MVVDAEPEQLLRDEEMLAALGYEPVGFRRSEDALSTYGATPGRFDFVLVSHAPKDLSALDLARALRQLAPRQPLGVGDRLHSRSRASGRWPKPVSPNCFAARSPAPNSPPRLPAACARPGQVTDRNTIADRGNTSCSTRRSFYGLTRTRTGCDACSVPDQPEGSAAVQTRIYGLMVVTASLLTGQSLTEMPEAITAPSEMLSRTFHAEGAQIYECKPDFDGRLVWEVRRADRHASPRRQDRRSPLRGTEMGSTSMGAPCRPKVVGKTQARPSKTFPGSEAPAQRSTSAKGPFPA